MLLQRLHTEEESSGHALISSTGQQLWFVKASRVDVDFLVEDPREWLLDLLLPLCYAHLAIGELLESAQQIHQIFLCFLAIRGKALHSSHIPVLDEEFHNVHIVLQISSIFERCMNLNGHL